MSRMVIRLLALVLVALEQCTAQQEVTVSRIRLHSRTDECDRVHTWHFKPADGELPIWEAGMYAHLALPGAEQLSPATVRHMSFASAPHENVMSFAMDTSSGSHFKRAMSAMKVNDTTKVFKIKFKHFQPAWPSKQQCAQSGVVPSVVFLAGGIGITPIRSLVMQHTGSITWRLIHVARDAKHLYAKELQTHTDASQIRTDHNDVAQAVDAAVATLPDDTWWYVCGSQRFADGMAKLLAEAGVDDGRIRLESFN